MKIYPTKDIRNVGIVGHGGTGKTQLVSSLLYSAGVTPRFGKVAEGTTTTDWDEEEIARKISIQTGIACAEWACTLCAGNTVKINFLDLPGYSTFITETKASLIAADAALITVDAHVGAQVTTEKVWDYCAEYDIPRAFVLTWMDRELSSFERSLESLVQIFGRTVVPLQMPIGAEKGFRGVIDLVSMKAHMYTPDGNGKATIENIPDALKDEAEEAHERLVEMIAEGDDEMMEEFFREGTIPIQDLIPAVRKAIVSEKIVPVLMISSTRNVGSASLLTFLADVFPHPDEHSQFGFKDPGGKGDRIDRKYDDSQPLSVFAFKTLADAFSGRINYFKVKSGVLKNDATLQNFNRNIPERFQHTMFVQGRQLTEIQELHAGDIGAITKLKETVTGDTLGDKTAPIYYAPAKLPEPSITFAVEPKTRADEDKIGVAIHKIMEEDPALRFSRDPQTKEFLLAGSGQQHIEVVVAKMQKRYNVNLTLKPPKVPYRETIRGKADAEGKHKKQSGGHGQFGDTMLEIKPLPRGSGFKFEDKITGGVVPRNYIPAVEEGVIDGLKHGPLGFQVVDIAVALIDGSYHTVDSSDMAFRIAGRIGIVEGLPQCQPVLLEPIYLVEIVCPTDATAKMNAILSGRRGHILGFDTREGWQGWDMVRAQMAEAEIGDLIIEVRSATAGVGSFTFKFDHMAELTGRTAEQIVAARKAAAA